MSTNDRSWGITPVPERLRTLSFLDTFLLWGNYGVSLLVLVAGAILVPALGLPTALLAILVGAVLGNALLGLAGWIGAERRLPGMVLLRSPLGLRGSYLPTGLNVLQNLGWATFELIVIATAASALSDRVFGFEATLGLGARLRCGHGDTRASRPDLVRQDVRAALRDLGRPRFARLPDVVDALRGGPRCALVAAGRRRARLLAGGRPDGGHVGLVAAARRRLHALRANRARSLLGNRARLLRPARLALRARRAPAPLPRPDRPGRDPAGDSCRRRSKRACAPGAHGGRDRRALCQRVLGRDLAPERAAARAADRCSS